MIEAYNKVQTLVAKFEQGTTHYLSNAYREAELRQDFLDDFFTALGWDVRHQVQFNPYEQEVKVEQSVTSGEHQRRADYAFFITPNFREPKFFVEAKKPCRNLKNPADYFQTIRYGWNAGTQVSILTDFEEFHILDCRLKPDYDDIFHGQHKTYRYTDYKDFEKFSEIYNLFSREAVAGNAIIRYADSLPKPKGKAYQIELFAKGYQSIDDSFLSYIDDIRQTLARAFRQTDNTLTSEELTEATQRTIDRLVFIRFLEDKGIETDNYVSEFGSRYDAWKDFITVCKKLDAKYNGAVFKPHFIDRQECSGAEVVAFKRICNELSHLNSPYDFNFIPIHILGSIYERFLGKVVHASEDRVTIELKPEIRKSGGVYYTPKYVVDYIVNNTIGKLIENKSPESISRMHFADIACGSGSFLIGAFELLLDYHNKYYQSHPDKAQNAGCILRDGKWILSIKQKQKILLNNIFGVDIDHQAIEVTQLSLYLKMLEDETTATANEMMVLFHEKILPDLSKNIVCGNSLIYAKNESSQVSLSFHDEIKLNMFNFQDFFPNVFSNGGFDAIIGNPPYEVLLGKNEKENKEELIRICENIKAHYKLVEGEINLYKVFTERALFKGLLNPSGYFGYIMPNSILNDKSTKKLRKSILENYDGIEINEFPEKARVFKDVTQGVCIYIISRKFKGTYLRSNICTANELYNQDTIEIKKRPLLKIGKIPLFRSKEEVTLFNHLSQFYTFREKKVVEFIEGEIHLTKFKDAIVDFESNSTCQLVRGDIVERYNLKSGSKKSAFIDVSLISKISSSPKLNDIRHERLVYQQVVNIQKDRRLNFSPVNIGVYVGNTCGYVKLLPSTQYHINYFLALLNSSLLNWRYKLTSSNNHILTNELYDLPFRAINFKLESDKSFHDKLVALVSELLNLLSAQKASRADRDINFINKRIHEINREIDLSILELYKVPINQYSFLKQV